MTSTNGKHSRRKKFSIFAKDLPTAVKNLFTDHCLPFEQLVLTAGAFLLRNKANGIQHTAGATQAWILVFASECLRTPLIENGHEELMLRWISRHLVAAAVPLPLCWWISRRGVVQLASSWARAFLGFPLPASLYKLLLIAGIFFNLMHLMISLMPILLYIAMILIHSQIHPCVAISKTTMCAINYDEKFCLRWLHETWWWRQWS